MGYGRAGDSLIMWNSTPTVAEVMVAGLLSFNTYAPVDKEIVETRGDVQNASNQGPDGRWTSINMAAQQDLREAIPKAFSISDIVNSVKVALGLPNKDLARIFDVTRPTLNAYRNDLDGTLSVRSSNQKRALLLSEISQQYFSKFPRSPGAMSKSLTVNGVSLLDALVKPEFDFKEIDQLTNAVLEKMGVDYSRLGDDPVDSTLYELTRFS